ncbi:MAG: hypothetical protein LBJ17_03245 [Dysgonamonadaceae bacterium]|jgi:hypothetical protein|nr:hypothetical protein [Dysgonamonadaceae bacterium]
MANKTTYYLPQKYSLRLIWSRNFIDKLAPNITRWGVPEDDFSDLRVKASNFQLANDKAELPNSGKTDRLDRKEKADMFSNAARDLVNGYLRYNKNVSDIDRSDLGIPVRDKIRTPIEIPKTHPVLVIRILDFLRLSFHFHDQKLAPTDDHASRAKPYGVTGAVIAYEVTDTPPVDAASLSRRVTATRTPHTIEFAQADSTRKAYFSICWQNEKGQLGPWSPIQTVSIP